MSLKQYYRVSAIVDNNVLIDFFELDKFELLFKVFGKVGIPKLIYDEEIEEDIIEILDTYQCEFYDMHTE